MRGRGAWGPRWPALAAAAAACLGSAAGQGSFSEAGLVELAGDLQDSTSSDEGADPPADEEGEDADEAEDQTSVARFTCALGVIVVITSLVIKELQSQRESFQASHPVVFRMVEATIEECVCCGAIAMCFIILRDNAFINILAVIARLPMVEISQEEFTRSVELIDAVIFWTFFYFFSLVIICVLFVQLGQRTWEDDEARAQSSKDYCSDTSFQRLRYAFFHPQVPGAGVKVTSEHSDFDVANVNFARYLGRATAQSICEVIHLPKGVILAPLVAYVMLFAVHSVTGTLRRRAASRADLYAAVGFSWVLLLLAVFLRCDIRRIYKQVEPPAPRACAPFFEDVVGHFVRRLKTPDDHAVQVHGSNGSLGPILKRWASGSMNTAMFARSSSTLVLEVGEEALKQPAVHLLDLQASLFWFGSYRLGPTALRTAIQGVLFGMSVVAAVSQWAFPRALLRENRELVLLFVAPFPAALLLVLCSLSEYVAVTKLETLVSEAIVNEVIAETKVNRFVPFVGTHTGRRLVQQMKYEAVMETYRTMDEATVRETVHSADKRAAYASLPEMEKAMLEAIFSRHDRDHSGSIDRSELKACLEEEGFSIRTAERVTADWMAIYDVDHSGYLSLDEFKTLHTVLLQEIKSATVRPADCIAMCRRLDKNSNGKLSAEELSEAFQEWLGAKLDAKDVRGIFCSLCPMELEENLLENELELRRIAEWIYRVYEMTKSLEMSQDAMMSKARTSFGSIDRPSSRSSAQAAR